MPKMLTDLVQSLSPQADEKVLFAAVYLYTVEGNSHLRTAHLESIPQDTLALIHQDIQNHHRDTAKKHKGMLPLWAYAPRPLVRLAWFDLLLLGGLMGAILTVLLTR